MTVADQRSKDMILGDYALDDHLKPANETSPWTECSFYQGAFVPATSDGQQPPDGGARQLIWLAAVRNRNELYRAPSPVALRQTSLPLNGAVNAGVGPPLLPVIQIGLGLLEAFEAEAFQRVFWVWPTPLSTFPSRSGSAMRAGRQRRNGGAHHGTEDLEQHRRRLATHSLAEVAQDHDTRTPVSRRKAFSCNSAQIRELE